MEINIRKVKEVNVIELKGDVDGNTAPQAQAQILPLATANARIIVDMSQVPYMSSAGLRMLLATYRSIGGRGGKVVLVGLSEEIEDTMSMTGFLEFFETAGTVDEGLAAIS